MVSTKAIARDVRTLLSGFQAVHFILTFTFSLSNFILSHLEKIQEIP